MYTFEHFQYAYRKGSYKRFTLDTRTEGEKTHFCVNPRGSIYLFLPPEFWGQRHVPSHSALNIYFLHKQKLKVSSLINKVLRGQNLGPKWFHILSKYLNQIMFWIFLETIERQHKKRKQSLWNIYFIYIKIQPEGHFVSPMWNHEHKKSCL